MRLTRRRKRAVLVERCRRCWLKIRWLGIILLSAFLFRALFARRKLVDATDGGGAIELHESKKSDCSFRCPEDEATAGREAILPHVTHACLQRNALWNGSCEGRKVVAYAITLTKDSNHLDGAAVLATSIDAACADTEYLCDLVAFLHDDVSAEADDLLRPLGFRVKRPGLPLNMDEIEDEYTRRRIERGGCCGAAELMKLHAFSLTEYHRVVHLDTDTLVLQPLDPVLNMNASLLYTTDVNMAIKGDDVMPIQGGFLVMRPDMSIFQGLVDVVLRTPFLPRGGWGGSGIGLFWGGINVQGLLPYYFQYRASFSHVHVELDRCVYNSMVDTDACRALHVGDIRSVHYTNCNKPWTCIYPHPKQPLCTEILGAWFGYRRQVQTRLGMPASDACSARRSREYSPVLMMP